MAANFSQTSTRSSVFVRWFKGIALREREVRDTLWLLLTVGWILLPHFAILPWWCGASVVLLLAWRTWLTWSGRRLPPRMLLIALMCGCGLAVYLQYRTIFGKDAGVAYLVLLLGLKLLEMRARRDIFVVIYLCLFVMLTGFFESQTIGTAFSMVVGVLLLVTALISVNFIDREPPYRTKLRLAGQLCLYALPLMAALFVLFPRVQGPLWGLPADAFTGKPGLSDSMSPGSVSKLAESDEMAFRAHFAGAAPASADRYWRGPVFGYYDGVAWHPSMRRFNDRTPVEVEFQPASVVEYTVTLEAQNGPWLLALDVPVAAPKLPGVTTEILPDLQVVALTPVHERVRYEARSALRFRTGMAEEPAQLQRWRTLPVGFNARALKFAAQLASEERAADHASTGSERSYGRRIVERVLQTIRTENFVYTLEPPALGRNAVDEFLFDTRRGFCEHYAGAFVVVMRAAGLPARVVTGYQGGEINPVDGYMEVRQRDAHAWAEVWLEGEGWVRVDPTAAVAPERIERGFQRTLGQTRGLANTLFGDAGWLGGLSRTLRFDSVALGNAWNQWVLGYGTERQSSLLSGFGIEHIDWHTLTIALVGVFGLLLLAIGAQLFSRRARLEPEVKLYFELCERVAELAARNAKRERERAAAAIDAGKTGDVGTVGNFKRMPHEGPRAYFARVGTLLPEVVRARAGDAFRAYEQLRYCPPAPQARAHPGDESRLLLQRLQECISTLRT